MEETLCLVSEDGQEISLPKHLIQRIGMLKNMPQQSSAAPISLPIKTVVLAKVIEYLQIPVTDMQVDSNSETQTSQTSQASEISNSEDSNGSEDSDSTDTDSESDDNSIFEQVESLQEQTAAEHHFFLSMDISTLVEVTQAANYLFIPDLLDGCCRGIARAMTGLKADEMRRMFNLPDDLTAQEKSQMAHEFAWVED